MRFLLLFVLMSLILSSLSTAAAMELGGLREYPRDLLRSVREEIRPEGLAAILTSGAAAAVARYGKTAFFDDFRLADTLNSGAPLGRGATDAGAALGHPLYLMTAMGATYFAAAFWEAPEAREFGLLGFEALSLAGAQTLILKYSVGRLRPDRTDRGAFPSGHTAASFSLATAAASTWGWRIGVPALLLAGWVGYTRMENNSHYLSDVLFGAGLGIASGRAVYKVRRLGHPERYAVSPFISPRGGGLTVLF